MVGLHAVRRHEPMSLESQQLRGWTHANFATGIDNSVFVMLSIDLQLGFDAEQERVIHDVHAGQEVGILSNSHVYFMNIVSWHIYLLYMMLVRHKVLVFKSGSMRGAIFDEAAESAALEIIDARNIVCIVEPQSVPHQDQMHLLVVLHLDGIDTIDARD